MPVTSADIVKVLMRERDRLFAYVWSIVGDVHVAEDVIQEVSLLAAERGGEVANEYALRVWVRRAARLKSLEALRAGSRRPMPLDESVLELMEPHWARYDGLDSSDMVEALRRCMDKLTANNRELLKLRYVDGMKVGEVARALRRKAATVYQAMSRLHANLAECVQRSLNHG